MVTKLVCIASWTFIVLALMAIAIGAHLYFEGRPTQGRPQYVAMGSSFAAGPAISKRADDSPWFCMRSRDNYAHQLARLRGLSLVDVSCGGATTKHILNGGLALQPPQIKAVTAETELVTITIGGNDIGYLANLMAMGCDGTMPWYVRAIGGCKIRSTEQLEQGLPKVREQLITVMDEIHRRAPKAQIVLVNYQTILPESGTCDRLGLTEEQVTQMRGIAEKLAAVTREAAQARGALLLDAMQLSQGHDVCALEPWINAMRPASGLMGAPLHPNLEGMTAIAQALNTLLGETRPASN